MDYLTSLLQWRACRTVPRKGDRPVRKAVITTLFTALLSIGLLASGTARTWHVPGDAPTIQGGIDLAQPGDDVLVGPGSYYESNITLKGGVWVHSEQGSTQTIVDAGNMGRAFDCADQQGMVTLEGFAIHRGYSAGEIEVERSGGGVRILNSTFTMKYCLITNCSATYWGGGMYASNSTIAIEDCSVVGCWAEGAGGGIFSWGEPPFRIERSIISENLADRGGGMTIGTLAFDMVGCEVSRNNATWGSGGGLGVSYANVNIRGCVFDDNGSYMIEARQFGLAFCTGIVENCTLSRCDGGYAVTLSGSDIQVVRTILSHSWETVECIGSNVTWQCCDIYGNGGGDEVCGEDLGGNFSADPLFCDAANGDYTLDWASPCLPGNHPNGVDCGLIGALDAGCGTPPVTGACCFADDSCLVEELDDCEAQGGSYLGDGTVCEPNPCVHTAIEKTTWGRIRAGYR